MKDEYDNENLNLTETTIATMNSELNKEKFKEKNVKLNNLYIKYYKEILPMNEKEYELFLDISVKKLPTTFRINKMK